MIELYRLLEKCEYHKDDQSIFIKFRDMDKILELIGNDWIEDGLKCYISCGCFIFNIEELVNEIDEEWTEEIIKELEKN